MATDKSYLDFILETVGTADVSVRSMMGEYVLYYCGKVVGDICDNSLFVKITPSSRRLLPNASEVPPYAGAKPYFLVEETEDGAFLRELLEAVAADLPAPKPRKKK